LGGAVVGVGAVVGEVAAVLLVPGGGMPGGFVFVLLVLVFVTIGFVFGVVLAAPAVFGGAGPVGAVAVFGALEALGAVSTAGFSPPAASGEGACEGAPVGGASGVGFACVAGVSGVVAAPPCASPRPKSMYAPNAPPPIEIAPTIAAATANPRFFGGAAAATGTSPGWGVIGVILGAPIAPGCGVFIGAAVGAAIGAPGYPPACGYPPGAPYIPGPPDGVPCAAYERIPCGDAPGCAYPAGAPGAFA
jgi:hypothetical protein